MKKLIPCLAVSSLGILSAFGQAGTDYINIMRQVQLPTDIRPNVYNWDIQVPEEGQQISDLPIEINGARFELWTISQNEFIDHLMDHKYVQSDSPVADIVILTGDPYEQIPRTRVDQPFEVRVKATGLAPDDPEASDALKKVRLMHHVQAYDENNHVGNIDRTQATLVNQVFIEDNDIKYITFELPHTANRGPQASGEERFTVYTIPSNPIDEEQLASVFMQVWPMAAATISGVPDTEIRFDTPVITVTLENLYPASNTWLELYPGEWVETEETPAGAVRAPRFFRDHFGSAPRNDTWTGDGWDKFIDKEGTWTMEVITETPFGKRESLAHETFTIRRSIQVEGSITTID